jgi:parvulin-like peptidyl-prolyl isomerase
LHYQQKITILFQFGRDIFQLNKLHESMVTNKNNFRIQNSEVKMRNLAWLTALVSILLFTACSGKKDETAITEPDRITVQHILIAFKGSLPKPEVTRSKEEAQKLAQQIYDRAKKGEDFDELVKEYTDDSYPGKYTMTNTGVKPEAGEYSRTGMVTAFGDVGFKLDVGEVGLAEYDPTTSPYGWHIIKRVK